VPERPVEKAATRKLRWLIPLLPVVAAASIFLPPLLKTKPASRQKIKPSFVGVMEDQTTVYATYAGAASCRECHPDAYNAWTKSHHAHAERLVDASLDDAAFEPGSTLEHGSQKTSFRKANGQHQLLATGLNQTQQLFQVERIIGESPLRQMLIPFPRGRWQATEAAFDPHSNKWFHVFAPEDRRPGEWGHWTGRGMNWNSMCATCHNTRLRKNYDAANDVYHTVMVERGVGCESCHGPMKAHNDWQHANKGKGLADPTIKKLSREQMFDTCAACHSRRIEITGDPKPGDSFFDHHLLATVDNTDTFYPDGQVRDENFEVSAFLGSRMNHKGVRCVDCHDFHSAKVRLPGNMMCLSCHGPGQTNAPVINPVTHSRHKVFGFDTNGVMQSFDLSTYNPSEVKETGGECVNCHMPQTVYMRRHRRHDHGFTIPDPLLTKEFGIPNACNRCHQDKDVDWAMKHVEEWYGEKMNRPSRERARLFARARNGDAVVAEDVSRIMQSDEQPYWRASAARLLERWIDSAPVRKALVNQISDTNALARQSAIQTLAALGESMPADVRSAISERLEDPFRNVRVVAAQALSGSLDLNSRAAKDFLHMLHHNADQPAGQMQLGHFALARGDLTNALQHFQTARNWDGYSPAIRHELAIVLSQTGQHQEALKEMQEAVRLAPDEAEFRYKLALAWNEAGDSKKCLEELENAVRLNPVHPRAAFNLGLARLGAGDLNGALETLIRAETISPHDPQIPYAIAIIYTRLGRIEEARQSARRALQIDPRHSDAAELLQRISSP